MKRLPLIKYFRQRFGSVVSEEELKIISEWERSVEKEHKQTGLTPLTDDATGTEMLEKIHRKIAAEQDEQQPLYQPVNVKPRSGKDEGRRMLYVVRWPAAAAAVLCVLIIGLFVTRKPSVPQSSKVENQQRLLKNDVLPGGNKAILTLANGSQIVLNDADSGVLASQGNVSISKTKSGQLMYHVMAAENDKARPQINTVSTPRGGQYEVVLPDGTKVWLNALSSLTFSAAFSETERRVALKGEAYFEVAKAVSSSGNRIPFKVNVNDVEVEVLGTHFNIMAYSDESAIRTTLLEGAVKLTRGASQVFLKPGRQAVIYPGTDNIKVKDVDVEGEVAWKNGYFTFNNENIHSVMRKIARWYDVDITYQQNMADNDFGGSVSKFENISEVLKMLELTGTVHFDINGRRVLVMP